MASVTETARAIVDLDGKAAGEKIKELRKQAKDLKEELKQLKISGDKTGFEAKKRELDGINKKLDEARRSTWDLQKVMQNLNGTSLKDLERAQRELTNQIRNSNRATKEEQALLKLKAEQLKSVKAQIATVRTEMNLTTATSQSMVGKIAHAMNNYFLFAMSAVASFTAIVTGAKKAITTFAEWDDKLADVRKTTGFNREEVIKLNDELKKINTRSAQTELLDLARVAGKLGYDSVNEVEGFVRAADQIKVALTEDLGGDVEESIRQLGKLADIFKLKDQFGIEQALLKTGSAINALGASSTANEGYMVEFAKRVAGVAPAAKISIQDVLGLASTLDQLGQTSEVSSTVFSQIIPDMFRNTAVYAQTAGMSLKDFSALLKKDANEAMIRMLQGLNGNNAGMEHMVMVLDELGIEGKRAVSVLGTLANNTDLLRETQRQANTEFRKGTSLTEEFNIKNNTMQARLDKAKKSLYNVTVELGQRLAPALTFSTNSMSYIIRALNGMISGFIQYRQIVIPAAAAIAAYTLTVNAATIAKKALSAATAIATIATKAFNTATKASPLGIFISIITAAASAFMILRRNTKDTSAQIKELNTSLNEQIGTSNALFEQLKKTAAGTDERRAAIMKLREVHGDYIDDLNLEKASLQEIEKAQRLANDELARSIALEMQGKETAALHTKALEIKRQIAEKGFDVDEVMKSRTNPEYNEFGKRIFTSYGTEVDNLLANLTVVEDQIKEIDELYDNILSSFKSPAIKSTRPAGGGGGGGGGGLNGDDPSALLSVYAQLGEEIKKAKEQLIEFVATGNLKDALATGETLAQLEAAKKYIDEIIAANGNLEAVIDKVRQAIFDQRGGAADDAWIDQILSDYETEVGLQVNPAQAPEMKPIEKSGFDKDFYLSTIESASSAAFDIWRNATDARLDYDIQALNRAMEKELSNKHLTEEQKDKIREKYAKKEKALKTEAFKKQKAADIIQAIINTALAVTRALANGNPALAVAAGIAGAAQTAVIAAQPIPAFYAGGDTGKGIGLTDQYGAVAGVVHANEYVVPEWMRGIPQVMAFERIMEGIRTSRGYAGGGNVTNTSTVVNNQAAPAMGADPLLISVINRLNENIEKGIRSKLVLQEFEEFTDKYTLIEQESGF
jgi:TP901 family phage tail tape measure protein